MTKRELLDKLREYRHRERYIDELLEERARLMSRITSATSAITGMPHGSTDDDRMASAIARLVELRDLLDDSIGKCADERADIEAIIDCLPVVERRILHLRYVEGRSAWQTANEVGYSDRQCRRAHNSAVERLAAHVR